MKECSVQDLKKALDAGETLVLLDVREDHEVSFCKIEGSEHVPLGELEEVLPDMNEANRYIVYCRSGARSAKATSMMMDSGFENVSNLVGGILAWSEEIDPSIPPY